MYIKQTKHIWKIRPRQLVIENFPPALNFLAVMIVPGKSL